MRLADVSCFPGGDVSRGRRKRSRGRRRSGSMRDSGMRGSMGPGVDGRRVAWGCRIVRSTGRNGGKMVGGSAAAESRSSKRPPLVRKLLRTGTRVSALKETALVAKLKGCG